MPTVISTASFLLKIAKELSIPVIVTEQYSKVFGPTVPELNLDECIEAGIAKKFEKRQFSMITPDVKFSITVLNPNCTSVVIFGIETHVCVQQTWCVSCASSARVQ